MPLKSFNCSVCGARCPKKYLAHGQFEKRIAWLRRHRKRKHPRLHKKSTRKMLRTKKKRGFIMTSTRKMRTNKRIGSRIKRKWGKIGAPKSAKRKKFLSTIRRKKRRRIK